ncbi:MAG: hypothetical protein LBI64_01310 [Coriobacteriales bacterium]|jgi:hypothetical protein|nr:hypothetical protein [Coriobacteriales bacterium]
MIEGTTYILSDLGVPLASVPADHQWAPLNLLFVILGSIACIVAAIRYLHTQRLVFSDSDTPLSSASVKGVDRQSQGNDRPSQGSHRCFYLCVASIALVAISLFIFALTQDMGSRIVALDSWTGILGALFGMQILLMIAMLHRDGKLCSRKSPEASGFPKKSCAERITLRFW